MNKANVLGLLKLIVIIAFIITAMILLYMQIDFNSQPKQKLQRIEIDSLSFIKKNTVDILEHPSSHKTFWVVWKDGKLKFIPKDKLRFYYLK